MLTSRVAVLTAVIALAASMPGRANYLTGTQISGSIQFGSNTTNYYNPANGWVPTGYVNTTQGATVTIDPNATEFGFADWWNTDTADFTDNTLTISDTVLSSSASSWTQTFTDVAFQTGAITTLSDNFGFGGLSVNLNTTLGTLTISWAGTGGALVNTSYTAKYSIVDPPLAPSAALPESSTSVLLLLGLGAVAMIGRRFKPEKASQV